MEAITTEKINSKVIQFAWDANVLYLEIKEYTNGGRIYEIRDTPEVINQKDENSTSKEEGQDGFLILTPCGALSTSIKGSVGEKIRINRTRIDKSIEYFKRVQEIFDYIEETEKAYKIGDSLLDIN